jgi:hypothetical protein
MFDSIVMTAPPSTTGGILEWFMEMVRRVLQGADLSNLTKEDFLAAVAAAYDQFVLPLDLPGPDAILDPLLKQLVLVLSGRAYDKFAAGIVQ